MLDVFIANVNHVQLSTYKTFLNFLSLEESNKIEKFYRTSDRLRAFTSKVLLYYILLYQYKFDITNLNIKKNIYGKPYINVKNFHFNISHSGELVIIAISDNRVGVDVEEIKPINLNVVNNVFSISEVKKLNSKDSEDQLAYFYSIWTLKESYIKAIGYGLSIPTDSFSIEKNKNEIFVKTKQYDSNYFFFNKNIINGYKFALCSKKKEVPLINYICTEEATMYLINEIRGDNFV